ncbi:hypothetical protein EDC02_0632 [Micromonospora sp. Llam0]|uniref:hypothetical protein n=1 Tax=Micromonospora sp. Llam0 TaxID=2485143 RepID=UPI000F4AD8AA|nr:hypothetical protein [Micromonospora sp. Llam0]ROO58862.1 hypothetical protein EDC02_0632 [Micromonospora sp. Llam0]
MPVVERGLHHDTEVLLRKVDGLVALLRLRHHRLDPAAVDRFADTLRALVVDSGSASAADRARVRATVHYHMLLASRRGLLPLADVTAPAGPAASARPARPAAPATATVPTEPAGT